MGLFGKIFDKKICDICAGEIGLLGNKKLEDGNCCKNCAAKLSPWFNERRHSTVDSIRQQLHYREENKKSLAAFKATKVIGKTVKIHIDEVAGKFMVVRSTDIEAENPDIIDISAVSGCELDIRETTQEIKQTVDGKQESYDPPRYKYLYDFDMVITVNHPYFDEIRYNLSPGYVTINPYSGLGLMTRSISPRSNREFMEYESMGEEIRNALLKRKSVQDPVEAMLEQIRTAPDNETLERLKDLSVLMSLNSSRDDLNSIFIKAIVERECVLAFERLGVPYTPPSANSAPAAAPAAPKFCPECGAPSEGGKFCQNCGSKLF